MGLLEHQTTVKNTFIHVIDEEFATTPFVARCRSPSFPSLSEITGMHLQKELKNEELLRKTCVRPMSGELAQNTDGRTTVMMRNIPKHYFGSTFTDLLSDFGLYAKFDFTYLPIDFRTGTNLGYAFVNFVSNADAKHCIDVFDGFCDWPCKFPKVCEASFSDPNQGLENHVERYRNSPVMHQNMPDEYKPRLFADGVRIEFPEPTKRIRAPRIRPQRRPQDHVLEA